MSSTASNPEASAPEPRLPLTYWLITGGTGRPPTIANFWRMASERKAAYREDAAYKAARQAARADFQDRWASTGLKAIFGINKREKPGRQDLMRLYGPTGAARGRAWGDDGGDDSGGDSGNGSQGQNAEGNSGDGGSPDNAGESGA